MSPNDPPSVPTPQPVVEPDPDYIESNQGFLSKASRVLTELPRHKPHGLFWLAVLATSTLTGVVAFQWLTGLPATPNCRKIFQATLSDSGQLYCADQAARKGSEASLSAALKLAGSIDPNDPLFEQSRQLADHWSKSILVLARQKVEAGNLKKGIELAQQVPKTSPVYAEAQGMIKDWQANWKQGEEIFQKAKKAIQNQDWGQATEQVRDLVQIGNDYWQKRADSIVAEISIEQQAFLKIDEAQSLASYGTPDDIAKAIKAVSQIDPKRLARKRVAEKIEEWSQKLIDIAKAAQARGDYSTAIQAAQKVPPNAKLAPVAAAYLQLGRAGEVEPKDSLWSSIQAYAYASQISSKTPVYQDSREQRRQWEEQVQNWGQLALARWFAGLDQVAGYQAATEQAAMVTSDQPRRIEAQTLIAFWNKQVDSFSDRQFLARAKQIALDDNVASLQLAIAEASKALSSSVQQTAQNLIAEWNSTVEKIQDQPILDQARALARKGDLLGAIQVAEKIGSDRTLYPDARDDIYTWNGQLQAAVDRPILNEAEALANEGRLSAAIARASDIGSSRVMYDEAQSRIADWAAQRRQIEAAEQPPAPLPEQQPSQDNSSPSSENVQQVPPSESSSSPAESQVSPNSSSDATPTPLPSAPSDNRGNQQNESNPNF